MAMNWSCPEWRCLLEDPNAVCFFYAWMRRPSCGGRLASAIRGLYTNRGIPWEHGDFIGELRSYSMPVHDKFRNVLVPKEKFDIWDVCASYILGVPQLRTFVRLALTLSIYDCPEVEMMDGINLANFNDNQVFNVYRAMIDNFQQSEQGLSEPEVDLEHLNAQIEQRACSVRAPVVDMGRVGDILDVSGLVCQILLTYLSAYNGVELLLNTYEEQFWKWTSETFVLHKRTPLEHLMHFFLMQATPSPPISPEVLKSFLDEIRHGAKVNLWPGKNAGYLPVFQDIIVTTAKYLLEKNPTHNGGAVVSDWLENQSLVYTYRLEGLEAELFQLEPVLNQMHMLYHTWCNYGRGKLKHARLVELTKGRLNNHVSFARVFGEMLSPQEGIIECCSDVLTPQCATSFANLVAATGVEANQYLPQRYCTRKELEAIRMNACTGVYQVLQPFRSPDYTHEVSINKLLLVLIEDILKEEPGALDFVDLAPLDDHPDLEVNYGGPTIVARKEVGSEVARLYIAWQKLPEYLMPGLKTRLEENGCSAQMEVMNHLLSFRELAPSPLAAPFIEENDLLVCRRATCDLMLGLVDIDGLDFRSFVQMLLQDLDVLCNKTY